MGETLAQDYIRAAMLTELERMETEQRAAMGRRCPDPSEGVRKARNAAADRILRMFSWHKAPPPEGVHVLIWAKGDLRPFVVNYSGVPVALGPAVFSPDELRTALWLPIPPLPPRETESETGGG